MNIGARLVPGSISGKFAGKINGISPVEYLIQYRISIACKILRESSDKIASVSVKVGYDNVSYFCRIFKKLVGKSPSQYRTERKRIKEYCPVK